MDGRQTDQDEVADDAPAKAAFLADLRSSVGKAGSPTVAREPVNGATIRTWCDAMSESNARFTSDDDSVQIAPPAMLNVWTMAGLTMGEQARRATDEPSSTVYAQLDDAGFNGVVAVNSDAVYHRALRPGDMISSVNKVHEVSEEKATGLGVGHFVTTVQEFSDDEGQLVGELFFRVLKFRPGTGRSAPPDPKRQALLDVGLDPDEILPAAPRRRRPRPNFNMDQAWFWEGLREHELRIQRFTDDGSLVHPPANCNPRTQHFDYDWVVSSGRGQLYSYTVNHYPQIPSFDYPLIVGLVELEEGVRVVSNITGVTSDQLQIGMPLEVHFVDSHDDVTLHQFRPARPTRPTSTLTASDVAVGDALPLCPIPITMRLIVSGALATRDFQDVHHDRDMAHAKGSKDIFMNILTSSGLVARWLGDWAGDDADLLALNVKLGAPNYPYDTMTLSGSVVGAEPDGTITIEYVGRNGLGDHMSGSATVRLPIEGRS